MLRLGRGISQPRARNARFASNAVKHGSLAHALQLDQLPADRVMRRTIPMAGSVQIETTHVPVTVLPVWEDACSVCLVSAKEVHEVARGNPWPSSVHQSYTGESPHFLTETGGADAAIAVPASMRDPLVVLVPEYCSLVIRTEDGDVVVSDKIEGDASIRTNRGNVHVHKIRGTTVALHSAEGDVRISSCVEGRASIFGRSIRARKILSESAELVADEGIHVETLFAESGSVQAGASDNAGLHLGTVHGTITAAVHRLAGDERDTVLSVGALAGGSLRATVEGPGSARVQWEEVRGANSVHIDRGNVDAWVLPQGRVRVSLEGSRVECNLPRSEPQGETEREASPSSSDPQGAEKLAFTAVTHKGKDHSQAFPRQESGKINQSSNALTFGASSASTSGISLSARTGGVSLESDSWIGAVQRRTVWGQRADIPSRPTTVAGCATER